MKGSIPLTKALAGMFGRKLADLPPELRTRVETHFGFPWDDLTQAERRTVAQQVDAQHPTNLADRQTAEDAFRKGFSKVSIARRNKRNAKRSRPSRQKVSDAVIEQLKRDLDAEGVKLHKQRAEALRRLKSIIGKRALGKRWVRLGLGKKKGT